MIQMGPFLSLLHVIHDVLGFQTGPFPSIVSFVNRVLQGLVSIILTEKDTGMVKVKDICYTVIILAYLLSSVIALADGIGLFNLFPLLAYLCVIFGILGGSIMLSTGLKKFREAKRRGLQITWYNSPSLTFGYAFFVYGLLPVSSVIRFIIPTSKVESVIRLIVVGSILVAFFAFLLLALIYRHKEE